MSDIKLTGQERRFEPHEVIVTKTDKGGKITYANDVFLRLSVLTEREALGQPHNLIRHPDMPASVFRLMWDTIGAGREIFAYVQNRSTNGDHYWAFAHVTPTFDSAEQIAGYHSNRRVPDPRVVRDVITPLYQKLVMAERAAPSRGKGIDAALAVLKETLDSKGVDYERFIFSLQA